jgi:hypothetical protein
MPGGYMHLESKGDMDDYLIVNPELTFFKTQYSRHTNFSQELMEFSVRSGYTFGNRHTVVIPRNGDLIGDLFLEVKLSNTDTHCYGLGNALIESVELEIGGQLIERIYGNCMNIIGEMTQSDEKRTVWDKFVGNHSEKDCKKLLIPLPFFCSNPGKYLQLIAMSYHEVRINIKLANRDTVMLPENCTIESIKLVGNYIYLDSDERRRIAQTPSEFLITSYITMGENLFTTDILNPISNHKFDISNFIHPTSEIFWVVQNENGQPCQSVCLHDDKYAQYSLLFNKNLAYTYKPLEYAHVYNPYSFNTNTPRVGNIYSVPKPKELFTLSPDGNGTRPINGTDTTPNTGLGLQVNKYLKNGKKYNQYIYSHSFSIVPDNNSQPAGSFNLSKIDNCTLELRNIKLEPGNYVFRCYQKYYNVLRYTSGMSGLAYSD